MKNKNETLGTFINDWLENVVKATTRYSTYTAYGGYIRNHMRTLTQDRSAIGYGIKIKPYPEAMKNI